MQRYQGWWSTALTRFQHGLDAVLSVIFPFLALFLTALGLLGLFASLSGGAESPDFLFMFGLANLMLALLFAAAFWLVRSNEERLSRWHFVAEMGVLLYCAGFLWPYLNRVWSSVQVNGRDSLFRNLS